MQNLFEFMNSESYDRRVFHTKNTKNTKGIGRYWLQKSILIHTGISRYSLGFPPSLQAAIDATV